MTPKIIKTEYQSDYIIFFRFADGAEGEIDFSDELDGEIFIPLKDVKYFRSFKLNRELNTITWQNGADFAPEFLYDKVKHHSPFLTVK